MYVVAVLPLDLLISFYAFTEASSCDFDLSIHVTAVASDGGPGPNVVDHVLRIVLGARIFITADERLNVWVSINNFDIGEGIPTPAP